MNPVLSRVLTFVLTSVLIYAGIADEAFRA